MRASFGDSYEEPSCLGEPDVNAPIVLIVVEKRSVFAPGFNPTHKRD